VVIDKGMNAPSNYAWIDDHGRIHFITTYSIYFAQDVARTPLEHFDPVDTAKNKVLRDAGHPEEQLRAYRTTGEYWGKERTVVVTYNPATARKQLYTFQRKLDTMRQQLLIMRTKVCEGAPHWKKEDTIRNRYLRLCERLHMSPKFYILSFAQTDAGLSMSFRKDVYLISKKQALCGKSIIITNNMDWTTRDIVEAHRDRWQVEERFRLSKHDDLVGIRPVHHWTDSKIRCHLFTCVVALTYLRMVELNLASAGINRTAEDVMNDMKHRHSVLSIHKGSRKPVRRLETPTKTQSEVLSAFGSYIDRRGVLQATNP
jgi:transposase